MCLASDRSESAARCACPSIAHVRRTTTHATALAAITTAAAQPSDAAPCIGGVEMGGGCGPAQSAEALLMRER
jgi:hypothetical protein